MKDKETKDLIEKGILKELKEIKDLLEKQKDYIPYVPTPYYPPYHYGQWYPYYYPDYRFTWTYQTAMHNY